MELITHEELTERLTYEPDTGIFRYAKTGPGFSKKPVGTVAGCTDERGYMLIRLKNRMYYMHRLAWFYVTGNWPEHEVDHINGNRGDNSWRNLREATRYQQVQNQALSTRNKSGYQGVSWSMFGKWVAQISIAGKRYNLGYFTDPAEAYEAYKKAKAAGHDFHPTPNTRKTAYPSRPQKGEMT